MWSGLPIQRRDQEHERAAYVHPDHNASGRLENNSELSFEPSIDSMTASKGLVSGYLFDQALSHPIHDLVMADIDAKFSHDADESTHKILNQAMLDVAQALGETDVKLASQH